MCGEPSLLKCVYKCLFSKYEIALSILKPKPRWSHFQQALPSVYTVVAQVFETAEHLNKTLDPVSYDTDGVLCVVDNSANAHIWNDIGDFSDYRPIDKFNVAR